MNTFGAASTVPATSVELELAAQLAAARAEILALKGGNQNEDNQAKDADDRERNYRRMPAHLWEQPILEATVNKLYVEFMFGDIFVEI